MQPSIRATGAIMMALAAVLSYGIQRPSPGETEIKSAATTRATVLPGSGLSQDAVGSMANFACVAIIDKVEEDPVKSQSINYFQAHLRFLAIIEGPKGKTEASIKIAVDLARGEELPSLNTPYLYYLKNDPERGFTFVKAVEIARPATGPLKLPGSNMSLLQAFRAADLIAVGRMKINGVGGDVLGRVDYMIRLTLNDVIEGLPDVRELQVNMGVNSIPVAEQMLRPDRDYIFFLKVTERDAKKAFTFLKALEASAEQIDALKKIREDDRPRPQNPELATQPSALATSQSAPAQAATTAPATNPK